MRTASCSKLEFGVPPLVRSLKMSQPPPAPPSLEVLRKEIDTIDEQVHRLLMARGDIIDRLISGEADPGSRLGVPPGARGRDDAAAGAASSRHPAARHGREHLARHYLDLHLCAGAVFGACRRFDRRIRDAGFGAVSFRIHRALRLAFQRAGRGRGGGEIEGRSGAGLRHFQPRPVVDRAGGAAARRRSSRGCRSSSAPTIRRRCRYSWCRASPTAPW